MLGKTAKDIEKLKIERQQLIVKLNAQKTVAMDINKITTLLQHFDLIFDNADFELQKKLLHSLIKEIHIKKADDINDRLDESIILQFSDSDLEEYTGKPYEVICDTVHSS